MLRLVAHIERLLLDHDCVILPGFGGFVLQAQPAIYREETQSFCPMQKQVMFNVTLQHTDGLLSESYMQAYAVDYRQARLMLEEDIEKLKSALQQDKQIVFGMVGSFHLEAEGQVVFTPGSSGAFNADTYGLSVFKFPELQPLAEMSNIKGLDSRERVSDVLYIPISRRLLRGVVASAAAVALFFLVSTPVREVNPATYTASFVPTEMLHYRMEIPAVVKESGLGQPERIMPAPLEIEERGGDRVAPKSEEKIDGQRMGAASSKKMYHIVIASFPTEKQADAYISQVDRKQCEHVNKVVRNGKYRIYADKFDNRAEAERYMMALRKIDKYKDAWLFISR